MSIELENPTTVLGMVDAIGNYNAQMRIALMVGSRDKFLECIDNIERLVTLAMEKLEDQEIKGA